MEYITVRQAAQEWNISVRLVQKYCAQGKVPGAKKTAARWAIPRGTARPQPAESAAQAAPTRQSAQEGADTAWQGMLLGLLPLMNTPFAPGRCRAALKSIQPGPQKDIALAEWFYFSGQAQQAARQAELYLACPNAAVRLSACLLYAYANLSLGQIQHARCALAEIQSTLKAGAGKQPQLAAVQAFVAAAAAVLLHLPLPQEMPPIHQVLQLLPQGLRAFALYVQAHALYLHKQYETSLGIAQATLAMGAEHYPIPAIYLHLVAVMDAMSLRRTQLAHTHLLAAWQLARPDDLIQPFGEHHGLLGGMLEAVIKPGWPDDFQRIIAITYRFSAGWRKVHNPATGQDVADNLSTTEFAMAMLAARGWTNREIGNHLGLSANTVKHYLSAAMVKLGVANRQGLKRFMLP